MGDILLTTPVISVLHKAFPQAQIDFLIEKPFFDILSGNPYLNNIIISKKGFLNQLNLIKKIRKEKYDFLFDFLGNPRTALISFFSKARKKIGFDFRGRKFAYNIRVKRDDKPKYIVDFKLDALRAVGIDIGDEREPLSMFVPSGAQTFAENFFADNNLDKKKPVIGISPTSRKQTRIWPGEYFALLADKLIQKYNAQIIFLWGPGEIEKIQKIISLMKNKAVIIPRVDIKQLAALIKKCNLLISNDNGPKHIAVAMEVPSITIYGPTQSECWNPPEQEHRVLRADVACIGCNQNECFSMQCMDKVTPEKVEEVFLRMREFIL
ncbi:glycosyltransferase family 9 protein [bacterium]|nr:glycosyltransferase family 9 protein [bacterium]